MTSQPRPIPVIEALRRRLNGGAATMRSLLASRNGTIGIAAALLFVPVVMVTGAAVDYARLEQFKTQLQATVDSAALSGAAAYVTQNDSSNAQTVADNYLSSNEGLLPAHVGSIKNTVTPTNVTSGSNAGYTVSVTATATIGTTFMRLVEPTMTVSASATAVNPLVTITINAANFNSSAADFNTLWYYLVSATSPTAIPTTSSFTSSQKLGCNHNCSNGTVTIKNVSASQQIGMALENETGGLSDYGCNQYQTAPGQWETETSGSGRKKTTKQVWVTSTCAAKATQWFFSNEMPPSGNVYDTVATNPIDTGYAAVTQNCNLQVQVSSSAVSGTTAPASGSCFSSLPQYAYPSCSQLNGQYANFYWNDMGGTTDDKDYNDAEISISCTGTSTNKATVVYLSS